MIRKILITYYLLLFTFCASAQSIRTIQADFVQQKTMKMLGDKMTSKGKLYYQAPDKLHWEYTTPYTYTLVMNGNKVLLKKGTRKDIVDAGKNKWFKEIGRIMINSVVVTSNKKSQELPLSKDMKSLYKKIVIYFNQKTNLAEKVVMYEKNGDTTEIQLNNVTTNKNIPASAFAVQ